MVENKTNKVVLKLNKSFVGFVADGIKSNLVAKTNKEIIAAYQHAVKLRPTNSERIHKRTLRAALKSELETELKARGITFEQYSKASEALVEKLVE